MADVFVSYKRQDEAAVGRLVTALRAEGLSVWWDRDIPPDAPWEDTIEREHEAARALVVCWSRAAVASENVKAEARRARAQNRLVQTFLEPCEPPMFFGERQGVDLSGWTGKREDPRFRNVLEAVRAALEGRQATSGVGAPAPARRRAPAAAILVGGAALAVTIAALAGWLALRDDRPAPQPTAPSPEQRAADERRAALNAVSGVWGAGGSCAPDSRYRYQVVEDPAADVTRVVVTGARDHRSEGEVVGVTDGVVLTSAVTPAVDAGRLVELSVDRDKLVLRDRRTDTRLELTRCSDVSG